MSSLCNGRDSRSWFVPVFALAIVVVLSLSSACRTSLTKEPEQSQKNEAVDRRPGSLHGIVRHEGAPQPGATVLVSSPSLQGTRVAVTNVHGDFTFPALPPGQYTVRIELEGLNPVTQVVDLHPQRTSYVTAALSLSAVAEAITVTAAAPFVLETTEVQSNYYTDDTDLIPAEGARRGEGENYASVEEGAFRRASEEPISTFAIDTDRASYANARRFIDFGALPPTESVRIEEMINYFEYGYAEPGDKHPFSITTEIADCPWSVTHKLLRVGVQGRRVPPDGIPPGNLVFLVDVSGSMQSPDKLLLVQESLKRLVALLRDEDRVAIVVYAGAAGVVLPSTSGRDKWAIVQAIENLDAGGSTAGGEGILLAYTIAADNFLPDGNNRVILATDGDFNVGLTGVDELKALIEAKRTEGVFLSVLGVGTGNLNDHLMETLADNGNGQYSYLDSLREAEKVLVREMAGTLFTIAKDVKIQVELNPMRVGAYRLIGYDNRVLAREDFEDDKKDAGELGAGHSVTAIYELVPPGGEGQVLSSDQDAEEVPAGDRARMAASELAHVRLRYKEPKGEVSGLVETTVEDGNRSIWAASDDFRFATAVAEFGLILAESRHKGEANWKSVIDLASSASSLDATADRAEFVELAKKARELANEKIARGN